MWTLEAIVDGWSLLTRWCPPGHRRVRLQLVGVRRNRWPRIKA